MKKAPPWWVVYVAAVGGFVTTVGDFGGVLTGIEDTWPSLVPLLPLVGTVVLLLLVGAGMYLGWRSLRDFRERRRTQVLEFFDDLLSNLEVARYTGDEARDSWLAKVDVIASDLTRKGFLDSRLGEIREFSQIVAYITYMRKLVSHHGMRRARREANQAWLRYSHEKEG